MVRIIGLVLTGEEQLLEEVGVLEAGHLPPVELLVPSYRVSLDVVCKINLEGAAPQDLDRRIRNRCTSLLGFVPDTKGP